MDCQPHAAVEHCCGETAMHGTSRIEVSAVRHCCDHDATVGGLAHVIAQSFGHGIQWQCPIGEPLNEFQATHRFCRSALTVPYILLVAPHGISLISPVCRK